MKLYLIRPRGFCAGVVRAINTVEKALIQWGEPIYVLHEIVHNTHVVQDLRKKGAVFVEDLKEIPQGQKVIFSAHGISPRVRQEAEKRGLFVIDATCILVNKVHEAAKSFAKKGYEIILIGHKDHVEVVGTKGEAFFSTSVVENIEDIKNLSFPEDAKIIYLTQTTLSINDVKKIVLELKKKYPHIESLTSSCICYATEDRQKAIAYLAQKVDLILVIGDRKSSNSNRLKELALSQNIPAYLINSEEEIEEKWLENVQTIGMTAGASTPEDIVQRCAFSLRKMGVNEIEEIIYKKENVRFPLPFPFKVESCAFM